MRTRYCSFVVTLFVVCAIQVFPQEITNRSMPVTIKLRSNTELEIVRELSICSKPSLIEDNLYSVRLRAQDIGVLRRQGIEVLVPNSGQWQVQKPVASFTPTNASNAFVQEMVNAVSRESLSTIIQGLQSFGTRYEYTANQDSAAVYLHNRFSQLGLDVVYDTYSFGTSTVYDIDFVTRDSGWIIGTGGLIGRTTNGGATWINHSSSITQDNYGIDFATRNTGWAVGANGAIWKSTNAGVNWSQQTSGITNTLYDVRFADDRHGIAVGTYGRILYTTNGGGTWTLVIVGGNTLRELSFVDSLHAWAVGTNGTIIRTTSGGMSWSSQTAPSGTNYLRAVCFIDTLHGWIAGEGPTILKTTNGGTNWIPKTPPPGIGTILRGVSFVDSLRGWIVDYDGRVLHTTDGGESWSIQYERLGWNSYLLNVYALNAEWVATCGVSGIIQVSTDGGLTWTRQTSNLPPQFIHVSQNVVGTIPGTATPTQECVIVAHYDSYSNNWYVSAPGANDNATGTSAVMEAARLCRGYQFRSTLKFVAVSGEELGMYGSDHYAFQARDEGRSIIGAINGDMIGYPTTGDSARMVIGSYLVHNWLLDSAQSYNSRYGLGLNLVPIIDNTGASDYGPFAIAGYDALDVAEATAGEIWGGADPYYHKTTDSLVHVNVGMVRNGTRLMLATLTELAQPIGRVGGTPGFEVTPASIDFNSVQLGTSKVDSLIVSNPGTDTLFIHSVNSDAPEFSVLPSIDTLLPGGSTKFFATFTPTTIGPKSGNIILLHNAAGSPDSVRLSGRCTGIPEFSILPTAIDFGEVEFRSSREDSVFVTNDGTDTLFIHSITTDNPEYSASVSDDTLPPGDHHRYYITFTPSGLGSRVGNVVIAHNASDSPDSVHLSGIGTADLVTLPQNVYRGWNIISLPLDVFDSRRLTVYPTSSSKAFGYDGDYHSTDTLESGVGYWMKFGSARTIDVTGLTRNLDTIAVRSGWNLIGSLSQPIDVRGITSDPPGLITSEFYGYSGKYIVTDTLHPGDGYWVRVHDTGKLILSVALVAKLASGESTTQAERIRILPISDLPPAPPLNEDNDVQNQIPTDFYLAQNHPNPFNPITTIDYAIPEPSRVQLTVYSLVGVEVARLVDGVESAGYKSIEWNVDNLSSGVYFYQLNAMSLSDPARTVTETKKLTLLK